MINSTEGRIRRVMGVEREAWGLGGVNHIENLQNDVLVEIPSKRVQTVRDLEILDRNCGLDVTLQELMSFRVSADRSEVRISAGTRNVII